MESGEVSGLWEVWGIYTHKLIRTGKGWKCSAMKLQIVHEDGSGDIGIGTALLRYVGYIVSGLAIGLGFLWIIWDDKKQGWHDKIASTKVIRVR